MHTNNMNSNKVGSKTVKNLSRRFKAHKANLNKIKYKKA